MALFPAVLIALALNLLSIPTARASFNNSTSRATYAGKIGYVVTGGSLLTSEGGCTISNSSTTTLQGIPAGSTVVAAYLYWGGSGPTVDANVTLNSNNLTADATFTDTDEESHSYFGGYKNVTSLVMGNGSFTFSNLSVTTTGDYCSIALVHAGWSLVVVYSNPTLTNHVINIYDGLQNFRGNSITTTPSGFLVPATSIDGKTTVITWEGDRGNSGSLNGVYEALSFNGNTLSDSYNPVDNIYNSTINTAPTSTTSWGVDIDTFDISSYLSAGETSASVQYSSGADRVILAAQVISTTTTNIADVGLSKSHSGNFTAGSNGVYSLVVHNNGPDPTLGTTTVTDTLPTGLSYVSASGTGWSCSAAGQVVTCTNATPIANGADSSTLSLTVAVSGSAPAAVTNTATVSNPAFELNTSNNTASDPTTIIGSAPPANGNKVLYVYDNQTLKRTPQAASNTSGVLVTSTQDWTLNPAVASGKTLIIPSATPITFSLEMACDDYRCYRNSAVYVELLNGGTSIGTSGTQYFSNQTPTLRTFTFTTTSATTVASGGTLVMRVHSSGGYYQDVRVYQYSGNASTLNFNTSTVINVDTVSMYSATYPATSTKTTYNAGDTVYVRTVISDPFGSFDVNRAKVTIKDPDGTVVVNAAAMTQVADSGAATRTFEYAYTLPANAKTGDWVAAVTGYEGTENAVDHTRNATFKVAALPDLLIVKSVTAVSDPVEGTTRPKALPGATMMYHINVSNNGPGTVDNNTLVVTDPIPANTKFVVGSGVFNQGSPSSGLSLGAGDITYSNDGGATWTYGPSADGSGADPNVTNLKFSTQGTMNAYSGSGAAPGFEITFKVIIK